MNQDDVQDQLNKVPQWIREYYGAYFAELRAQLERPDVFAAAVPDWMRGYKRVITVIGSDGVLVIHAPVEIEFSIPRDDGSMFVHYPALPSAMNDLYHFMANWEDPESAREEAITDLAPYIRP